MTNDHQIWGQKPDFTFLSAHCTAIFSVCVKNKTKRLIDTIASYNGYREKMAKWSLTYLLSYPKSRDAIASKNSLE